MPRRELLDIWQKVYQRAAPPGIRKEILVPFLAYRIQENAYGSLKPSTLSELRRIDRGLETTAGSTKPKIRTRITAGTRILRRWRGEAHEVTVTESGYGYRGTTYRSLSEIARKITGTRWSGPLFFGQKRVKSLQGRFNG